MSRRFLVIGRVGDTSLHKSWIADAGVARTWDLQLSAYGLNESLFQDGDLPTVIDRGTRYDSIARHFAVRPTLLERYAYVMIIEDDIAVTAADINRMFEIAVEHDLTIAQPSLSYDSYISYPILLNSPGFKLRYTNFLEAQANVIKSSYLKLLLPLFAHFQTGWGIDHIAALCMENPPGRAAIIDAVVMTHTRPLYSGPLYNQLAASKIDPWQELHAIRASFSSLPPGNAIYGAIDSNGRRMGGPETMQRTGMYLMANAHRCRTVKFALRTAAGLLWRSVNERNYEPKRAIPLPNSIVAHILAEAGFWDHTRAAWKSVDKGTTDFAATDEHDSQLQFYLASAADSDRA